MSFLRPGRIAIIGALLIGAFLFFRESFSKGIGPTVQSIGSGGQAFGQGIESVLGGIGRGASSLLNPFFTIVDLASKAGAALSGQGNPLTTPSLGGAPNAPSLLRPLPPGIPTGGPGSLQQERIISTTGPITGGQLVTSGVGGTVEKIFVFRLRTPAGKFVTVNLTQRGMRHLVDNLGYELIATIRRFDNRQDAV